MDNLGVFILISLALSFCINAVYIVFNWEGMLFEKVGLILESYLPEWICKMLFSCATCMSGVYGAATYYQVYKWRGDFIGLVTFILVTACLATMVNVFLEVCKALKEVSDDELGRTAGF